MKLKGFKKSDGSIAKIYTDPTLTESDSPADAASVKAKDDLLQQGITNNANYAAGLNTRLSELENGAPSIIAPKVTEWLEDNVNPVGSAVTVDSSLTVAGSAADAKKTGDEISHLKSDLNGINSEFYEKYDVTECTLANGTVANPSNEKAVNTTTQIPCSFGDIVTIYPVRQNATGCIYKFAYRTLDANGNTLTDDYTDKETNRSVVISNPTAAYIRFAIFEYNGDNKVPLRVATYNAQPYAVVKSNFSKLDRIDDGITETQKTTTIANMWFDSSKLYASTSGLKSVFVDVNPNTVYKVTKAVSKTFFVAFTKAQPGHNVPIYNRIADIAGTELYIRSPNDAKYIVVYVYNVNRDSTYGTEDEIANSVEITERTVIDNYARNDIVSIKNVLFSNINSESLWEIGSLGSAGEAYARNYEIRTAEFLPLKTLMAIDFDRTVNSRICLYESASTNGFIARINYTGIDSINIPLLKESYPNANYYRFTIYNDDTTDVTDVSRYSWATITGIASESNDDSSDYDHYINLLSQARYSYTSADSGIDTDPRVLTLLQFSDVHGSSNGMKYALKMFDTYSDKIDDIIHTGDAVLANFSDGLTNWISTGCARRVLNVIGNHDTEENFVLQAAGKDNVYNAFFAPYISGWGVVQPTGVNTSSSADYHALYYYKDYVSPKIRLIVLDTNFWDNAETAWLTATLADARTNEYAVMIACHDVKHLTEMLESNFSNYKGDGINENTNAYANQPDNWLDPVDDFIESGGEFICMIAGHNHAGHIGTITNYSNVFCFVSDKTSAERVTGTARNVGETNENTVNIVTVNAKEKLFKIVKIGAEVDGKMRGKHVFCYDYANKRIISQW